MQVAALLMILGLAIEIAAFWPGIMTWDAIRQYGQAVTGRYDDWHPPAMNWLWRQLRFFAAGPAPMLILQSLLYWGGSLLLVLATMRRGRRGAAATILLLTLSPIAIVLVATILKDSLFAGALLMAAGLLAVSSVNSGVGSERGSAPRAEPRAELAARWLRVVAAMLLVAAATLRFNAVPACLPLLVALAPAAWRRTLPRLAATSVLAAVPLVLALPLANAALRAERSGVELSLVIYDLGGIGRFSHADVFPPTGAPNPVAINRDCYSPISWDRYAWWGEAPCAIGFATLRAPLMQGHGPYGWWAAALAQHPVAYGLHRLTHFDRNVRFWVRDSDLPGLSLASDPNRWGYMVEPNGVQATIATLATASLATPLGWPACWIALAFGLVVLRPSLGTGGDRTTGAPMLAPALAWSALLYALSYLPLSVASEVRYHFWTMAATGIAAALLLGQRETWAVPRWRRALAVGPFAAILLCSIAARMV
ncbi:hypothetical protein [Sphingomonas sp. CARO-RG-8B-R24-01]|uniref:hypothetical protein n=1 Tax=Sphingomonas sp. CARO-RG-8B-R24-01 TaxID=2914831 RepID=UPI001F563EAC|nr:hypothetical protein [Sphingomonas sp. CARO-RG-8B-R24-01]